ncbi:MAG: alpha/beta hydrolase [Tepidiformaceae bacterium]
MIRFRDEGEGSGTPFVFIHGWACDSGAWAPQVADLRRDHRCLSVDLRGRGDSAAIPPYDVFTAAEDVARVIDALGNAPAIVVGHSLGGVVALCLNRAHPELVAGVVTGDSPLERDGPRRWPRTAAAIREAGSMEPVEAFIEEFFIDSTPADLAADIRALMLTCDADVAAGMLDEGERVADALPGLIRLADAKPFMAFWAERPLGDPNLLRDLATFVRQEPIAGAGHFFQLERPEITNALLRAFEDDVLTDPRQVPRQDA